MQRDSNNLQGRRQFLDFLARSPLLYASFSWNCSSIRTRRPELEQLRNVADFEAAARATLDAGPYQFIADGADDLRTLKANRSSLQRAQIRARRLVDVSAVAISVNVLGEQWPSPIAIAPLGLQGTFHPDAELATIRGANQRGHRCIMSTVSTASFAEICREAKTPPWFQLYPTTNRDITKTLLQNAKSAGCKVLVLTVDTPVVGNRENHTEYLEKMLAGGRVRLGNLDPIRNGEPIFDPSLTWDFLGWLRQHCEMKLVLKGIVTEEDARLAVEHHADGIIVSNHGGRQGETNRSTFDCLPEVLRGVGGTIPVLIDGGFRRGTDVFKALAIGAKAVCIGRPYAWGTGGVWRAGSCARSGTLGRGAHQNHADRRHAEPCGNSTAVRAELKRNTHVLIKS